MDDLHRIMYLFFCGYIHYDSMSSVCNLFLSVVFEMLSFPFPVIQKGNFVLSSLGSALLAESSHQTNSLTHQSSNHCVCTHAHTHNHISAQTLLPIPMKVTEQASWQAAALAATAATASGKRWI